MDDDGAKEALQAALEGPGSHWCYIGAAAAVLLVLYPDLQLEDELFVQAEREVEEQSAGGDTNGDGGSVKAPEEWLPSMFFWSQARGIRMASWSQAKPTYSQPNKPILAPGNQARGWAPNQTHP